MLDMGLSLIVTTQLDMERVAASRISEVVPEGRVEARPMGFKGIVLVWGVEDKYRAAELIERGVPEAERVIVVEREVKADIHEIVGAAEELVRGRINSDETFAVRTTRRGRHKFTSIDVNVAVGDAVRRVTGASVNLSFPDKIVQVEIIGGLAAISVVPGSVELRKMRPGKYPVYKLFRRVSLVQMPYLGPLDACRTMGVRIGREVQTFEVGELVVAFTGYVDALQLKMFLDGLFEGIESRFAIQRKTYGRRARRVPVQIADLYQLVRERSAEHIIVLEPEGEPISKLADELERIFIRSGRRVNILVGSRVGIPRGIYRFADMVVDIAPGITISTDYAAASGLIAIATLLHERALKASQQPSSGDPQG